MNDTTRYIEHWFISEETQARRFGLLLATVGELIAASAVPGVVCSQADNGDWWLALGCEEPCGACAGDAA